MVARPGRRPGQPGGPPGRAGSCGPEPRGEAGWRVRSLMGALSARPVTFLGFGLERMPAGPERPRSAGGTRRRQPRPQQDLRRAPLDRVWRAGRRRVPPAAPGQPVPPGTCLGLVAQQMWGRAPRLQLGPRWRRRLTPSPLAQTSVRPGLSARRGLASLPGAGSEARGAGGELRPGPGREPAADSAARGAWAPRRGSEEQVLGEDGGRELRLLPC